MDSPSHGSSSSTSTTSTPRRGQVSKPGTPTKSGASEGKSNAFSKFFTQLKNLIAEAATIEPTSDVAPGVDHCCKTSRCHFGLPIYHDSELALNCASILNSTLSTSQISSRLIVYRDCDRRGRKILFDSEHVSSDYIYLKPTDPKLLKDLGEYVFGCVPLASSSSSDVDYASSCHKRFCKWNLEDKENPKTLYIWSKIFELCPKQRGTPVDYSSSSSDQSSSGYESGGAPSGKTFSLPLFQQKGSPISSAHQKIAQTVSLPGRMDTYKTNLSLVWILSQNPLQDIGPPPSKLPFLYMSPLIEKLMLNPLSSVTKHCYHNNNHFVTSLKNISTSLHQDLTDFLANAHIVNLSLIKPPLADMVNVKLVIKFLELIMTNVDSCVVLNLKKLTEVKGVLYFLKMFLRTCVCKCSLVDLYKRNSLVETGTDVISATMELDCVDSGIELESSSSRLHAISSSSMRRKWSIVSEESELDSSQDEGEGHVSFHLGDVDVDQSEDKLCLGEVDLSRLKGHRRISVDSTSSADVPFEPGPTRPPVQVKLSFGDTKIADCCPIKYTPCYHCNGTYITDTGRFNPFYFVQVMSKPGQVTYDFEYVSFMKIIELYGTGSVRNFNIPTPEESSGGSTSAEEDSELAKKLKEFVEGYVELSKSTNDSEKLDSFVRFQMEEIRDYVL